MNRLGELDRSHERPVRAAGEGNAGDPGHPGDRERVACGLLYGLVAHDGGDPEEFDLWVAPGEQQGDGVVVSGVTVEDDLLWHESILPACGTYEIYLHMCKVER